jgi:hypothetical protein
MFEKKNIRACQETGAIMPAPVNAHKIIRGAWSISPVKKKKPAKPFYSLPIAKYCPHMPSDSIKCTGNPWGKSFLALKFLIYDMQNSP